MGAARRATQKDVAKLAAVSQATVSLVLSGTASSLPATTLQRITSAARDLGYTPNRFAQALKTSRTMTIACVVPDITNPFYPALMRGIQSVTDRHDYDLIAVNTDGTPERERHLLTWLQQRRVDGVIGVFFMLRAPDLAPLTDSGMAVVRVEAAMKHGGALPIDDIFIDGHAAAGAATRYLLARGHQRIAMIAGQGGPQAVRIEGYLSALDEAHLASCVVLDEQFNEDGGLRAGRTLLAGTFDPSAVFAANDLMAIGVMQALRERGRRIPEDVAVVGFDDIPAARLVSPPLSTVAQFQYDMGVAAAKILMERLQGRRTGHGTASKMPFTLIEREST